MIRILYLILLLPLGWSQLNAQSKPNVLFLAVDDMNDWIGTLESTPRAITPNLDRLAARGVNFTNAHTAGVFCAPSRAAIFTGQFASTTGCYRTANYFVDHPEIEPLQVSFSNAGYRTLGAGKLFHHPAGAIDVRGWNEFFLRHQSQREGGWPLDSWSEGTPFPNPFPNSIYNEGQQITGGLFLEWGAIANDREKEMADTIRIHWAVEKLKEEHDEPFFLGAGIYAPHYPNYCPQKYFDLYKPDEIKLPPYKADDLDDLPPKIKKIKTARSRIHQKLENLDAVDDAIHGYLACISYADAMMGRVLDALEASPHADNTIVVLWSDHGYHHGEKGDWGKHTLWERTSNVPFIWAGPGIANGQKCDITVSLIDMYPTLVELCGLPKPQQKLEGESLAKTLADPGSATDRHVFLPHMNPGEYAVINRDWRYIRYGEDGEELYDLQTDPNEWHNLAANPDHATRKRELQRFAPATFAEPARSLNARKDLVVEGETFYWETGKGNYTPSPKYLPYTQTSGRPDGNSRKQTKSFTNTVGTTMRLIPAGTFQMGTVLSPDEVARRFGTIVAESERPQHRVTISKPFYMGTTEVTVDQFRLFVNDIGYRTEAERDGKGGYGFNLSKGRLGQSPKYNWKNPGFPQLGTHPVVNVSWNDARKFCDWLSRKEGRIYSLPTEAQWEYACRAGTTTSYQFGENAELLPTVGNVLDGTANAAFPGWSKLKASDGYVATAPVGSYKANRFGLFDMHGNVSEWCSDWYGPDYYAVSPPLDPRGPTSGPGRVRRGASWGGTARTCRAGGRAYSIPSYRYHSLGFRLVSRDQ